MAFLGPEIGTIAHKKCQGFQKCDKILKWGLVLSPNDYLQSGFQTTSKIDHMTSFKILSRGTSFKMYH